MGEDLGAAGALLADLDAQAVRVDREEHERAGIPVEPARHPSTWWRWLQWMNPSSSRLRPRVEHRYSPDASAAAQASASAM